jgi:hypothetical protein
MRRNALLPDYTALAMGQGPFGTVAMGGMMTVVRTRPGHDDGKDPGWHDSDAVPRARRVSTGS